MVASLRPSEVMKWSSSMKSQKMASQQPEFISKYNRPGAKISQGVVQNWWRQAMMGGAKAYHDGIKAFWETDFTEDLQVIDVPTLVMHGDVINADLLAFIKGGTGGP
jgi:alpha-beta hydrolase superfamily lysophospholipase